MNPGFLFYEGRFLLPFPFTVVPVICRVNAKVQNSVHVLMPVIANTLIHNTLVSMLPKCK